MIASRILIFCRACALALALFAPSGLAQILRGETNNYALRLTGGTNTLQIEGERFADLEEATIEGWVRFRGGNSWARFFDFGAVGQSVNVGRLGDSPHLDMEIYLRGLSRQFIAPNAYRTNEWMHLAATIRKGRAQLYLNGLQVVAGRQDYAFNQITGPRRFWLGRNNWFDANVGDLADTAIDVDEFRVWNGARTQAQIQDGMFRQIRPDEPGLAFLLGLDNGEAKDLGPRKAEVKLIGGGSIERMELPRDGANLAKMSVLTGRVVNKKGEGVADALVSAQARDVVGDFAFSGPDGEFEVGLLGDLAGELRARKEEFAGASRPLSVRVGERIEEVIQLHPPETIGGTVTAFDNSPLNGIPVQLLAAPSTNVVETTWTDPRGAYSFEGLAPGEYRAQIMGRNGPILYRNGQVLKLEGGLKLTEINFVTAPPSRGVWQAFNTGTGLPSDQEVRRILFERNGAVWFATYGGAARFDGADWQIFTTDEGLPDDYVYNMTLDARGNIWFATARGVARYDGQKMRRWGAEEGVPSREMDGILAHSDGSMWFAGADGTGEPFLLHMEGEKLTFIRKAEGLPGRVYKMCEGKGGEIWMAGLELSLVKYEGKKFAKYALPDPETTTDTPSIGPDGAVWFGGRKGVWKWDGETMKLYSLVGKVGNPSIACTFWTREGQLWAAGASGVFRFAEGNLEKVAGDDGQPVRGAISIAEAPDGALWFGTLGLGARRYDPEPALEVFTMAHGLIANNVRFSGRTADGALQFYPDPRSDDAAQWNGKEFQALKEVLGVSGWKGRILESSLGIVIPTENGALLKVGDRVERLGDAAQAPGGMCFSGIETKDGSIWVCVGAGAGRFKNGKWEHHTIDNGFPLTWSVAMAEDRAGRVLVGNYYSEGLAVFENSKWTRYTTTNGLAGMRIYSLFADADGSTWIATDGGVSQFKDGRFTNYAKRKDGLPTRGANAVYRDSRGWLWIGTGAGVTRWDGRVWSTLRVADGLGGEATRSIVEGPDGSMWIGSDDGLTRYRVKKQKAVAPVVTVLLDKAFTAVEKLPRILNGRRVQFRAEVGDLKTRPEVRRFVWGVFLGDLDGASAAKLSGWMPATSSPMMEWTAPAAGRYTMAVRYVDRDLNYSDPVLVPFEVVPPWYMNAFIAGPVAFGSVGLLGWAIVARMLYMQKRREAERLRAEMLQQEKDARAALELKNRELEKAMEAAESANRTKSQFLATMSHELRTPLNAILGYSEMLEEELEDRKDVIPDLKKIHSAGKHLLGLINDVLDLSKIEAGKMTIFPENFDIATTVQEIARTVEPIVKKNGNRLEVSIAPDVGSMFSDLTKVRQTLFNLLSNAAKFTENGNVSIAVSDLPGSSLIQFTIADSGIGMTEEQIGKLFQAFSQADASTSRKYGGTGLGLALSRNFCRLLGGDIEVRSEPGKGSAFTVRLPRRISAVGPDEVAAGGVATAAAKDRPHILVIDDDPAVRELMNRHLIKEGYAVSLAASGEQGLELARARKPDIITVDIIMPGQDGWSVLNSLKADKGLQNIPVVLVSMLDEKPLGFSLGAADYIVKPIDWERLSGTLQKLRTELPSNEVLVVEDDAAMRDMLTRQLEKQTWSVRTAENGRVALEVLKGHTPGIVLLDLMMPEMDGFAFLEEFRRNKDWQQIPVIVVTAKDLSPEDLAQLEGRIRKVVQKSAQTMDEVVAEIRAASMSTTTRA